MDICFNMDAKRRGGQQARVNPTEYRSTVVCIAISVRAEIELIGVERVTTAPSLSLSLVPPHIVESIPSLRNSKIIDHKLTHTSFESLRGYLFFNLTPLRIFRLVNFRKRERMRRQYSCTIDS